MKKGVFAFITVAMLSLTSCGGALSYEDYTEDYKGKIVTNITELKEETDNQEQTYSVDYFTKTIEEPIKTVVDEEENEVKTRDSYTLTYKKNDGYRLTKYTYDYATKTKTMTSDVLYDIKRMIAEEDLGEDIYYVSKYVYDPADSLYSVESEKNVFVEDVPLEEQASNPLWTELYSTDENSLGLVLDTKKNFYYELLQYGDINNVTEANFRSLAKKLFGAELSYNAFVDSKQYIIKTELSNTDVFDMNLSNLGNLFTRNKYYIKNVTVNGTTGLVCEYDLKAIFVEDNDSVFSKEIKELTAPVADQLKTETAEE